MALIHRYGGLELVAAALERHCTDNKDPVFVRQGLFALFSAFSLLKNPAALSVVLRKQNFRSILSPMTAYMADEAIQTVRDQIVCLVSFFIPDTPVSLLVNSFIIYMFFFSDFLECVDECHFPLIWICPRYPITCRSFGLS
jgi:hypothetical protein